MKPLINLISRMFLAVALCVSAPVAFAGDSSYDIDKERIAQEIREKAMSGDLDGATEAVETYEDSPLAAAKLLIATGGDVNAKDRWSWTPLHWAARDNDERTAQLLLENGAKILANRHGETPLHVAAWKNTEEVAKMLLAYGGDVNVKTSWGDTPLHTAASWFSPEVAKLLIDNGANVNERRDNDGPGTEDGDVSGDMTPILYALFIWGYNGQAPTSDANALRHKRDEVVQLLIDGGADVNAMATTGIRVGYTAKDLMFTYSWLGTADEALVAAGGRCNQFKHYEHSPYHSAERREIVYQTLKEFCTPPPEPKADYTGLYANAAFAVAGAFAPSWVDTQTFAFNQGDKFITGQSLSIPVDDFTFAAKRVQVNDLTDYEFAVKWEMEF